MILRTGFLPGTEGFADAFVRVIAKSLLFFILCAAAILLLYGGCDPLLRLSRLLRETVPTVRFSKVQTCLIGAAGRRGRISDSHGELLIECHVDIRRRSAGKGHCTFVS